jgi:hypothetical protein
MVHGMGIRIRHYLFQLGERDTCKSLNKWSAEHIPIVVTEIQYFVLERGRFGYIECSL